MFSRSKFSTEPLLFDIRINNTENDIILLKGDQSTASSVLLSGTIVLSVSEPIQIKSVYLRLIGRLRVSIPSASKALKQMRYTKYEKRFYEHCWDNINIQNYFENLYSNFGNQNSIASISSDNLSITSKDKNKSNLSLSSAASSLQPPHSYHTLVKGNYEFPFSAVLPGSLTESVEGLPNASVVYKLHATIERSKNATDLLCQKKLRIVRTLSPDAVGLSETVTVDNSWPKKIDYSISVPTRAVAIGSTTSIHFHLVPLLKGLKLGSIRIVLIESSQYCGGYSAVTHQERAVTKMKIKDPLGHIALFRDHVNDDFSETGYNGIIDDSEFQDAWDISTNFQIPASLSKCTQDCNALKNIKVRHRLKFVISLINPDGHISELRASLSVQLYISPFVALGVKSEEIVDMAHQLTTEQSKKEKPLKIISTNEEEDDDLIFKRALSEYDLSDGAISSKSIPDLMTPPKYEKHIYDKLWSEISDTETINSVSGSHTPVEDHSNFLSMSPERHMEQLNRNLEQLNIDRETRETMQGYTFEEPQTFSSNIQLAVPDVLIKHDGSNNYNDMNSPIPTPGFSYISKENSFISQSSSPKKDWEVHTISRVPSYVIAMKNSGIIDDLPPIYPDSTSHEVNLSIEKPQLVRHRASISSQTNTNRNTFLRGAINRSNNSSSSSLYALTRSSSSSSFTLPILSSPSMMKNNTTSKHFGLGMTPYGGNQVTDDNYQNSSKHHLQTRFSKSEAINRQRSNSLNSIMSMFTTKGEE